MSKKVLRGLLACVTGVVILSTPVTAFAETNEAGSSVGKNTKVQNTVTMTSSQLTALQQELEAKEAELDAREAELNAREKAVKKLESAYATATVTVVKDTGLLIDGANLQRIGAVTDEQVNAVKLGFNSLPSYVQTAIVAKNYRFEVTDEDIEKLITGGGTNSWYGASAASPLYVLLVSNHQTTANMTRTTIHECGHCYDDALGMWSQQATWLACYSAEGRTLSEMALVSNSKEWFAECFYYYITNPSYLQSVAPTSYVTIDALFKGLEAMMK